MSLEAISKMLFIVILIPTCRSKTRLVEEKNLVFCFEIKNEIPRRGGRPPLLGMTMIRDIRGRF